MSKIKEIEHNFEVIAGQVEAQQMLIETIIVEAIRTNVSSEKEIIILCTQGIDAFQKNPNLGNHEKFGAIGTLTGVLDMIKRAKNAGIIP